MGVLEHTTGTSPLVLKSMIPPSGALENVDS